MLMPLSVTWTSVYERLMVSKNVDIGHKLNSKNKKSRGCGAFVSLLKISFYRPLPEYLSLIGIFTSFTFIKCNNRGILDPKSTLLSVIGGTELLVQMSSSSEQPPLPQRKTVKLVVSPQYFPYGYHDYTGTHYLSETPALLKTVRATSPRAGDMTLFFRGRRITPEEENMTFEALMKTVLSDTNHTLTLILVFYEYG